MREGTIFQLAVKPKDFPAGLRLRNIEWGVLFAVDGTTPIGQIRRSFSIPEEDLESICATLMERGLIKEKPVSLSEYMAAQTAGSSSKQSATLLEMLQGGTAIRALTLEAGKGAPSVSQSVSSVASAVPTVTPLITPPTGSAAPMSAKMTPPPLPPEALVEVTPRLERSGPDDYEPQAAAPVEPVEGNAAATPEAAQPATGSSPRHHALNGSNGNGKSPGPLSAGPLRPGPIQAGGSQNSAAVSAGSATAELPAHSGGKSPMALAPFTPLKPVNAATATTTVAAPRANTNTSAASPSSTHSGLLANHVGTQPITETDTAGATASIINPAPGPAEAVTGESAPPAADGAPLAGTSGRRRLSLKSVIEFILSNAEDVNAGQLDVYRVFIRVNTRLLKRNGVHSLRFEEDRLITDSELQTAILTSVERTLGIPCPKEVFV